MLKVSLVAMALLIAVVGCQKTISEKDYEGKWSGKVTMSDADIEKLVKASPNGAKDLAKNTKEAKSFLDGIKISLDLKADKTYSMSQGQGTVEGSWVYKEQKLTLTPLKADGKSKEEIIKQFPQAKSQFDPLVLNTDKEAKQLTGQPPANQPNIPSPTISFSKDATAKA